MPVRIKTFSILNYRSCQKTVIQPNENLSILIGSNGSGKSNILNAFLLLKKAMSFRPWTRIERKEGQSNKCSLKVGFDLDGKQIGYRATIKYFVTERNEEKVTEAREEWNFFGLTGKDVWIDLPSDLYRRFRGPLHAKGVYRITSRGEIVGRLGHQRELVYRIPNIASALPKGIPSSSLSAISDFVQNITYYSASQFTNPAECPASFGLEAGNRLQEPYGYNSDHVRFLFDLYSAYKHHRENFKEFLSAVGKEGIGLVDTIKFPEVSVPSSQVEVRVGGKLDRKKIKKQLVIPQFVINKTTLSPSQLSEGTFKTLAVLLYLSTDKSRLLLLEEPEVCVHHGLLASIIELIKSYADQKQIIVSTHSDFVLDHVAPENVFLVRNEKQRGTAVSHLPKALSAKGFAALKDYLSSSGNLGEYWRHAGFKNA